MNKLKSISVAISFALCGLILGLHFQGAAQSNDAIEQVLSNLKEFCSNRSIDESHYKECIEYTKASFAYCMNSYGYSNGPRVLSMSLVEECQLTATTKQARNDGLGHPEICDGDTCHKPGSEAADKMTYAEAVIYVYDTCSNEPLCVDRGLQCIQEQSNSQESEIDVSKCSL